MPPLDLAIILDVLKYISADDRDVWVRIGMALKAEYGEKGYEVWIAWSRTSEKYREADALATWRSFKPGGGITIATLIHEAKKNGYQGGNGTLKDNPEQTATKAKKIWSRCEPAPKNHPYLVAKGLSDQSGSPFGLRIYKGTLSIQGVSLNGALVIPLYNGAGEIRTLQFITKDGQKLFLPGRGSKTGNYWTIGKPPEKTGGCLYTCEGIATAISIHLSTGEGVVAAIDAGNIPKVARTIRKKYPDAQLVIAADRDPDGIKFAIRAARDDNALVALPPEGTGKDFNDLLKAKGPEAVKTALEAPFNPSSVPDDASNLGALPSNLDKGSHVLNGNRDAVPPAFSEDAAALAFRNQHDRDFRYVPQHGHWFRWDNSRWARDDLMQALDAVRKVCRELAEKFDEFLKEKGKSQAAARALASNRFISGVEHLARSDRDLVLPATLLDADPFLLGTPGGVVDLRTGKIREARRDDYITRSTRVAPGGECPKWHEFLADATGEDGELAAYLRRLAGYCLTGTVEENLAFFFHGPAAAGKSTFTETLMWILGDYAVASPIELLTPQGNEHPTILASLLGVRLSVMSETEGGRAIAESRFKSLVAGDRQAARFMRQDYFYFNPQAKLILHGNHRPRLKNTDESMRRRLHVVPFIEVVPLEHRDKKLKEKLREEAPGILDWAIKGCLEWHQEGINPPPAVIGARDEYFESEDVLGRWLDEACVQGNGFSANRSQLWDSWHKWSEDNGESARTNQWLLQQLRARGFGETKMTGNRMVTGIGMRHS